VVAALQTVLVLRQTEEEARARGVVVVIVRLGRRARHLAAVGRHVLRQVQAAHMLLLRLLRRAQVFSAAVLLLLALPRPRETIERTGDQIDRRTTAVPV
jgi:hypothetical protein